MPLTVETGAALATADSYVTVAQADAYALDYGLTWDGSTVAKEAALRRATQFVDATYRLRFPGYRKTRRLQALEWPRLAAFVQAYDTNTDFGYGLGGYDYAAAYASALPSDVVPVEIVRATIVAAATALNAKGAISTSMTTGDPSAPGELKSEKAGDHAFEYYQSRTGSASSTTVAGTVETLGTKLDELLSGVLIAQSGYSARASRA